MGVSTMQYELDTILWIQTRNRSLKGSDDGALKSVKAF
jgi:hypothetical protein